MQDWAFHWLQVRTMAGKWLGWRECRTSTLCDGLPFSQDEGGKTLVRKKELFYDGGRRFQGASQNGDHELWKRREAEIRWIGTPPAVAARDMHHLLMTSCTKTYTPEVINPYPLL